MTRPTPRRSSLAGSNPVAPPQQATSPAVDTNPEPVEKRDHPAVKGRAKRATKYPPKVSFYQDRHDTERVRGAILYTQAQEGPRSLSQFIHRAVMTEVERLEVKYNGGKPFPPIGALELPQGRPIGE